MEKPKFVYVTYICTTPEKLWQAISDPKVTSQYWGHNNVSDWKPGSRWEHQRNQNPKEVDITGTVVQSEPPRVLVITWADPDEIADPVKISRVRFEIEEFEPGVMRLTLTHDELEAGSNMERGVTRGWPIVLSNLKTLLETGTAAYDLTK